MTPDCSTVLAVLSTLTWPAALYLTAATVSIAAIVVTFLLKL